MISKEDQELLDSCYLKYNSFNLYQYIENEENFYKKVRLYSIRSEVFKHSTRFYITNKGNVTTDYIESLIEANVRDYFYFYRDNNALLKSYLAHVEFRNEENKVYFDLTKVLFLEDLVGNIFIS